LGKNYLPFLKRSNAAGLKDKYGVSWQVVPTGMDDMLQGEDRERIDRVTRPFLVMKKIDIARLQEVYDGK